jgi:prophage regulatory protein
MQTSEKRLIRRPVVQNKTGMSVAELYRRMGDGKFPKPVKTGVRSVAWVESEVDGWIQTRIDMRDAVA